LVRGRFIFFFDFVLNVFFVRFLMWNFSEALIEIVLRTAIVYAVVLIGIPTEDRLTLTHHVARNYTSRGICCNWVTVGWVITPGELEFWTRDGKGTTAIEERARTFMPMGRMQTPGEIAAAVAFLLSDDADQVTDTELWVTGGLRV
jgi:hypothetical protein